MLLVFLAGGKHLVDATGLIFEGDDLLAGAPVLERIAAGSRQLAIFIRGNSGLGEGDEIDAAHSELASLAVDDYPLDPEFGTGRIDAKEQAVSVEVLCGLGDGLDVLGCEAFRRSSQNR
ncbi:hypothetical protein [Gemmobacter sp. 24YEA27]|uniref:hypothetical protein n=1 Tax=Gemmobacter sp. 24YEA27 TaxID=3040672 RepID=UPI0024B3B726|nr:hypothetical protein [Gemmobacter sp. 24YEA27]